MSMFSEIRWRFTVAVAAGLVLIAVHAFQWTIVDRISPFLYLPLVGAVWWIVVGAGLVSLTCFTKIRTIGVRALAPIAVIVLSVLIATFAPFTSFWLDFDYWRYAEERLEVVERVADGELEPNVEYNAKLIGLGDSYPVVSARSEEHTSELQSLMRNTYAAFCLKQKNKETD